MAGNEIVVRTAIYIAFLFLFCAILNGASQPAGHPRLQGAREHGEHGPEQAARKDRSSGIAIYAISTIAMPARNAKARAKPLPEVHPAQVALEDQVAGLELSTCWVVRRSHSESLRAKMVCIEV